MPLTDRAPRSCFLTALIYLGFWYSSVAAPARSFTSVHFGAGNAGSSKFEEIFTLNDTAADGARLLDELNIEQAVITGHACGRRVAQVLPVSIRTVAKLW